MRRKQKGFAMVFTLVVIMLLVVLSTIVASLSATSYVNSIQTEKNNKLKLAAESGVDRAEIALRNYMKMNPKIIVDLSKFNPSNVTVPSVDENGITTNVTIGPDDMTSTIEDSLTGRYINYIKIHSEAVMNNNISKKRIVDAVIDKGSLTNVYFKKLFGSSFTVAHLMNSNVQNSFLAYNNTNLAMSGDMFIQANNFYFQPSSNNNSSDHFLMGEGDIYFKNNSGQINFDIKPQNNNPQGKQKTINLFKDDGSYTKSPWQNTNIKSLYLLGILPKTSINSADDIQKINQLDPDPQKSEVDSSYVIPKQYIDPDSGERKQITLVTYKVENGNLSVPLDFQKLVNGIDNTGTNHGIYHEIIKLLQNYKLEDGVTPDLDMQNNYLDNYGRMYKLLLVQGDLNIEDKDTENYDNYIIYCTGTVKFLGNAHFFNSSIFANNIIFPDTSVGNKNIEFYGADTLLAEQHKVGINELKDFQDYDKNIINNYLVSNLDSYADYMQFKILSWTEK